MMAPGALKKQTFSRLESLKRERDRHINDWIDLSDYVMGYRGRYLPTDNANSANVQRNDRLYNETAKHAALVLASGMLSGHTSPARPWLQLTTPDPELSNYDPVRIWLDDVRRVILAILAKSNFYDAIYNVYLECGTFGTTSMGIYRNFASVCRFDHYTVGSFCVGMNGEREADTLYREYTKTVGELGKQFGKDALSKAARNLWDRGQFEEPIKIIHGIEPNPERDLKSPLASEKAYRSVYYEAGCDGDKPLLVSGFDSKPFVAPRWSVVGEEVYSTSYPGIDSLASNKSLQIDELDKAIAIEKMHNPPLVGDSAIQAAGADLIAGGITWIPNMGSSGKPGLAPVYDVNPRIAELGQEIAAKERRIEKFYYADLFMMLANMDRANITATEIMERKEEKMLMLGPVLSSLNHECLDPLIDRVFSIVQEEDVRRAALGLSTIFPPPPPEMNGVQLGVEYIGVLQQAQRAISTASTESTVAFAANLVPIWPEARHKINVYEAIDDYARSKGASPKMIRSDDEAAALADQEQQAMAAMQQAQMVAGAADTAKTLADTDAANEDSALNRLMGMAQ